MPLLPQWMKNKGYEAKYRRLQIADIASEGIVSGADYGVTPGTGLQVQVAAGTAYIVGDEASDQGTYRVQRQDIQTLTIGANSSGSTRIDVIVVRVRDSEYSGSLDTADAEVVAGTPGAGAPAVPNSCLALANVTVANGAASITGGNIADVRALAQTRLPLGTIGDWKDPGATWTFSSADAPTYVVSVNADMTLTLQAGMKIKITHAAATKYFIVTAVGAFSAGVTLITLYGGTDYTLSASALTNPFYATVKSPFGFPLDPAKWTVLLNDTSSRDQTSAVSGTWYNLGALSMAVPIGIWDVEVRALLEHTDLTATAMPAFEFAFSTSTSSVSDTDLYAIFRRGIGTGSNGPWQTTARLKETVNLAAKTTHYLIARVTNTAGTNDIHFRGATIPTRVRARCAYL